MEEMNKLYLFKIGHSACHQPERAISRPFPKPAAGDEYAPFVLRPAQEPNN